MNNAYQKRFCVLQSGVLTWYASEQTSQEIKGEKGWISCCGLEIEADTGENAKSRFCFTVKALSGSTTRRIELACDSSPERCEWVRSLGKDGNPPGWLAYGRSSGRRGLLGQVTHIV
jgi:hypothetical protein